MKLTEKSKIRIVYICALALILAGVLGLLIYNAVCTARAEAAADAVELEIVLHQIKARLDTAESRSALESEQEKWDGYAKQLQLRREERRKDLLILVNPWNTVPEGYTVRLAETEAGFLVDSRCAAALEQMLQDCRSEGCWAEMCSAYRTRDYQQMLYDNKVYRVLATGMYSNEEALAEAAMAVAVPGTSEHELGLAVDILDHWYPNLDQWQQYTLSQQWLMENSWKYGFILRYPVDKSDVTGIIFEPWHYRYVGVETAKAVFESGLCFEEYLETLV